MTLCPAHSLPLVRTHGGSLTCLGCRLEARKERASGWMRSDAHKKAKRKLYNKTAYSKKAKK